jgi:glutamate-1-semialdehyde 2,1-aminomutase
VTVNLSHSPHTVKLGKLAPGSQNWHQFPISAGVPALFRSADGALLYDLDGREIVDLYCGSGAVILGHANSVQIAAVRAVLDSGATVSLRHPVELELADHLVELTPGARYAAFFKTGSEAVHQAITTAVRATGRRRILTTTYHGWLLPLGDLRDMSGFDIRPLDWTSPTLLADATALAGLAACVVVSPTTETPDLDTVRSLVDVARASGAVVIFDEVKAGFRYAYPTVSASIGVTPDLTVVSKAIGNGFPIAAVLGGDLMATEDTLSVYSTYASEIMSETAALACVTELAAGCYQQFAENSSRLYDELAQIGAPLGVGVHGVPTFFRLELAPGMSSDALCRELYHAGVLYHPLDQVIVSAAHSPRVIDRVCAAFDTALREVESRRPATGSTSDSSR